MVSRFYLLIIIGWFLMTTQALNYMGSLTENECRHCKFYRIISKSLNFLLVYLLILVLASNDINKKLQAIFSCPKKWRIKPKSRSSRQIKYPFFHKK